LIKKNNPNQQNRKEVAAAVAAATAHSKLVATIKPSKTLIPVQNPI
jgi:hypothetical protein